MPRKSKKKSPLNPHFMLESVLAVQDGVIQQIRDDPHTAFNIIWKPDNGGKKPLVSVDFTAELSFKAEVNKHCEGVIVYGEESITSSLNFTGNDRIHILVDMIDGTDLLERGFSNWCSAIVVFHPSSLSILATYVFARSEDGGLTMYYYTRLEQDNAAKKLYVPIDQMGRVISKAKWKELENILRIPDVAKGRTLNNASVCMYGQKSSALKSLLSLDKNFKEWVSKQAEDNNRRKTETEEELRFRFYNLAGNPMMVRLAEGIVDAVFDINGQLPHDVVPGAFMALNAGAVMKDINKKHIDEKALATALLRPADKSKSIRYVLATNETIADNLIDLVSPQAGNMVDIPKNP